MEKIRVVVAIDIETDKTFEEVKKALTRGIYRALDTEPNYIAPPAKVELLIAQK